MKKWKIELIMVTVAIVLAGVIWWGVSTSEERTQKNRLKALARIANQQSLEIAIIKQNVELRKLKAELAPKPAPHAVVPPVVAPPFPVPQKVEIVP
jgi:cytoskeletal protein RodZ